MRRAAAALLAALAVVAAACGGGSGAEQQAKAHFEDYRAAETTRSKAENELRKAIGELSRAAGARDRAGALAAVAHGREALSSIYRSLDIESDAAKGLQDYEETRAEGRRMADALRRSRDGTRLVERELEIAARDPFLDTAANAGEISRLASESNRIAVPAAFARRRAARAIALALGVEPPLDVMFDTPQSNPGG